MELLTDPFIILIVLGMAVVIGPIIGAFLFASLALFIWSFRRIWPVVVGIARWGANWRNFVPFFGLLFIVLTILILLVIYGPPILRIMMVILLVIIVPIFLFIFLLALVVWVVRFFRLIRLAIS